jgi:glycine betaine/proline transport system substrate-binding protein
MVASIEKAVADQEWVVVTGWKPHYKWAQFDLKYLEDPKGVYPSEKSYIVTRKGFTEENPDFKEFLSNFYFTGEQLADMMLLYEQMDDNDAAAQKWYEDHKELFQSWMPEEWLQ